MFHTKILKKVEAIRVELISIFAYHLLSNLCLLVRILITLVGRFALDDNGLRHVFRLDVEIFAGRPS